MSDRERKPFTSDKTKVQTDTRDARMGNADVDSLGVSVPEVEFLNESTDLPKICPRGNAESPLTPRYSVPIRT